MIEFNKNRFGTAVNERRLNRGNGSERLPSGCVWKNAAEMKKLLYLMKAPCYTDIGPKREITAGGTCNDHGQNQVSEK